MVGVSLVLEPLAGHTFPLTPATGVIPAGEHPGTVSETSPALLRGNVGNELVIGARPPARGRGNSWASGYVWSIKKVPLASSNKPNNGAPSAEMHKGGPKRHFMTPGAMSTSGQAVDVWGSVQ